MARAQAEPDRPAKPATPAAATESDVTAPMRIAASWAWRILVIAAVIALFGLLVSLLREIVIPVMVAILLSALLVPFSNWLQRHRWPKGLAVAVCELSVLIVVAGLVTVIVFQVRGGFSDLEQQTIARYGDLKNFLLASPLHLTEKDINDYFSQVTDFLQKNTQGLLTGAVSAASLTAHVLAGALIALFTTLFILIDGRGMWSWVVRLFPVKARAGIIGAGEAGWITLTTFVKIQIFVAFVDAVGIGLGAFIVGLFFGGFPLVIPIAIAVFLGSFIPVVGAVLTGVVAVFVALVYLGPLPALIMLGVVILVQQLEGHVLQPFVMGNAVKVHPVAVVLAVATGGFVAGIPGALFAVPLVAVLNVMIGYIARGEWRTNPHPSVADVLPPTKGRLARAR